MEGKQDVQCLLSVSVPWWFVLPRAQRISEAAYFSFHGWGRQAANSQAQKDGRGAAAGLCSVLACVREEGDAWWQSMMPV